MKKICILGLGHIGLPTALLFANNNIEVIGVDINNEIIKSLENGSIYFKEDSLGDLLKKAQKKGNFTVSQNVSNADAFIICVPTPLNKETNLANLDYVIEACEMIVPSLKKGNLVIIESTISPGSSENIFKKILEKSGLKVSEDFYLVHCPERAIPGRTIYEMENNARIIGGFTQKGCELAKKLYSKIINEEKIFCTDIKTAEVVKLMENTYRDLNIALANEFAMLSEELNIDVWEAIKLANYHPRVEILKPGPGVGGHCIAIDPWFLIESSSSSQLIQMARKINDNMPNYTLMQTKKIIGDISEFPTVTIFGVSYKGNVDDTRESPALTFIQNAKKLGWRIKIYDPFSKNFEFGELMEFEESVKDSDCIVVLTDHDAFKDLNPKTIAPLVKQKKVLDARNILNHNDWIEAGFEVKILGNNKNKN